MPTPKAGYRLKDGSRVPGTTTIIGHRKEGVEGLIYWGWNLGMQGKDYRSERDGAADIGTAAHAMVEAYIRGVPVSCSLTDPEMISKAESAYQAYLTWAKNFDVKIIQQEIQLVSERYRYGGTPDAIGLINNQLVLLDWKTSNKIRQDYLIQLPAYKNLWEENYPDQPITGGMHLLRFAKAHGDFAHHYFPDLSEGWRAFKLLREMYEIDKELKKRAA